MTAMLGAVPGSSLSSGQLDAQASVQLQPRALAFCLSLRVLPLPRSIQGRPDFVIPVFVSTFSVTGPLSLGGISLLTQMPILH